MADGIRKQIFKKLEEILGAVESLNTAKLGSYELRNVDRPAIGILPDEETTEHLPDDIYLESLRVAIRVVVDEAGDQAGYELEDVLGDVHRALFADRKLGGLADDTVKVGIKWLFLDQVYPRAGADLNVLITYQTEETDPADINFDAS